MVPEGDLGESSPRLSQYKYSKHGKVDPSLTAYIFADKSEEQRVSSGLDRMRSNIDQGKWTLVGDKKDS